jgi:DNA-binding NtrC family response regulator
MKILIVDDEIEICKRLQRELQKEGHEVEYRTSPLNILEELKKARRNGEPYNLLLLNIRMPGIDGLTLLRSIREERVGVEVIITTGYRDEQIVIEAIRLSAENYLNKPISLEELDAVLSHVHKKTVEEKRKNEKYHILVVDDEKDLCIRIKRELEKEGYQVVAAYTAEECIEYFKKNKVDVLITDIRMPRMSGLEMLKRCREITNDFVPIIITGHGDHETAKKALKLYAHDYLRKPLSLDALITSVKKGIEHLNALRGAILNEREEK